ncbi:MAG: hypothetical protein AMXMBFR34_46730 [Myxococcaceae bacterium]
MVAPVAAQPPPPPPDATPPPRRSLPPMHTSVAHPELEDAGDEHDEVFEIFRAYDRDASGSIDRGEFSRLLEALGMEISEEELAIALDVVDSNRSGRISWDEFKAWWSSH